MAYSEDHNASRHLSSGQLAMFMTAEELRGLGVSPFDTVHPETGEIQTPEETWKRKGQEAQESGLVDSVRREGVHMPVNVYHLSEGENPNLVLDIDPVTRQEVMGQLSPRTIGHGHHRVEAAYRVNRKELLPVRHYDRTDIDPARMDPFLFAVTDLQNGNS